MKLSKSVLDKLNAITDKRPSIVTEIWLYNNRGFKRKVWL